MKKDDYKKELDSIVASKEWKRSMKENLNIPVKRKKQTYFFKRASLIVAVGCLILAVIVLPKLYQQAQDTPIDNDPSFTPREELGLSGIIVRNPNELQTHNGYDFSVPSKTMPIFKNLYKGNGAGETSHSLTYEQKDNILRKYIQSFELKDYKIDIQEKGISTVTSSDVNIELEGNDTLLITFSDAYINQNKITIMPKTKQEAERIANEIYQKYKQQLEIKNPLFNVHVEYNIYGDPTWSLKVSEKTDNQNLNLIYQDTQYVELFTNEQFIFNRLRIHFTELSQIQSLSIISEEEARERYEKKEYLESGMDFKEGNIEFIEMKYIVGPLYDYYLPYYCLYLLNEEKDGYKSYSICYVSALNDQDRETYVPNEIYFN